jgi:hypothetical protein
VITSLWAGLFDAIDLPCQAISHLLDLNHGYSILLITESWLLSSLKYSTHWKQWHTYEIKQLIIPIVNNKGSIFCSIQFVAFLSTHLLLTSLILPNTKSLLISSTFPFNIFIYYPICIPTRYNRFLIHSVYKYQEPLKLVIEDNGWIGSFKGNHNSSSEFRSMVS